GAEAPSEEPLVALLSGGETIEHRRVAELAFARTRGRIVVVRPAVLQHARLRLESFGARRGDRVRQRHAVGQREQPLQRGTHPRRIVVAPPQRRDAAGSRPGVELAPEPVPKRITVTRGRSTSHYDPV